MVCGWEVEGLTSIDAMKKVEELALSWILRELKVTSDQIIFQSNSSPDFLIPSLSKAFEAKRLYGDQVIIGSAQYAAIRRYPDCSVLVFADENVDPVAVIPASEIPPGESIWHNVRIKVLAAEPKVAEQAPLEVIEVPGYQPLEVIAIQIFRDADGQVKVVKRLRHGGFVISSIDWEKWREEKRL